MSTVMELIEQQECECVGTCAAADLAVREEVREMCAADKCHLYNTS